MKDLYKTDLPKVKAYVNYKRRGVFDRRSTAEEMQEDWDLACAEIEGATLLCCTSSPCTGFVDAAVRQAALGCTRRRAREATPTSVMLLTLVEQRV